MVNALSIWRLPILRDDLACRLGARRRHQGVWDRVYWIIGSKRLDETNRRRILFMAFGQVNAEFHREALQHNAGKHLERDGKERNQGTEGMRIPWRNRAPCRDEGHHWDKINRERDSSNFAVRRPSRNRCPNVDRRHIDAFGVRPVRAVWRHDPSRSGLGAGAGRLPAPSRCHATARSDRDGARRGEWQRHPEGIRVGGEGTVQEPRLGNRVSGRACIRGMPASTRARPVSFRFHLHRDADA